MSQSPALSKLALFKLDGWALGLVLLGLWVWGLGQAPLFDVDEGAFAEASREMLSSGDWGHTTLNGRDRFDKPILIYWLQSASMAVLGVNEFAVRLPSALAALVWCLAVWRFANQHLLPQDQSVPRGGAGSPPQGKPSGPQVGALAAGMLASCLGVMLIGRASTADALLNTLITLALLDLWRHMQSDERAPQRRAFVWMALGFITKGPVAWLVPGAACLIYIASTWQWRKLVRLLNDPLSWALLLGIALPWYAYALNRHGMAFVNGFFMKHNVGRFTQPMEGHSGGGAYYLLMVPLLMLPWSALLAPALAALPGMWRTPVMRYLWGWAGFVLVFFSFSGTKLPHYMLYGLTPLVLLCAVVLARSHSAVLAWALALMQVSLLVLLTGSAALAQHLATRTQDGLFRSLIEHAPAGPSPWLAVAVALVLLAVWAQRRWSVGQRAVCGSLLLAVWLVQSVLPWWAGTLQGPIKQLAQAAQNAPGPRGPITQWKVDQPSLAFYLQRPTPRADPQPGGLALTRVDRIPQAADVAGAQKVEVVSQVAGFALVRQVPAPAPQ
jgi:4-amino-4-deoxy-L-arabinose transferase-like glycosyltransferase